MASDNRRPAADRRRGSSEHGHSGRATASEVIPDPLDFQLARWPRPSDDDGLSDSLWFRARPRARYRIRLARPEEFEPVDLVTPDGEIAIVIVVAINRDAAGDIAHRARGLFFAKAGRA
jgi:hypothetical protein